MNPRRIKLIIGLMTLALAGIISLQIYWIGWNIRLNQEQFDKNVYAALNRVASKLQYYEILLMETANANSPKNGKSALPQMRSNGFIKRRLGDSSTQNLSIPEDGGQGFENGVNLFEYMKVSQSLDAKPLAERIPLDLLAKSMQEEIENRGIKSDYQYGVYSKARGSYIIVNDHFVVEDRGPQMAQGGVPTLFNSPYRVALFTQDIESPGDCQLALHQSQDYDILDQNHWGANDFARHVMTSRNIEKSTNSTLTDSAM